MAPPYTAFGSPVASAEETREFLSGGLAPVGCRTCAVRVLVKKNSPKHTSIQWTTDSSACPVYAASDRPAALQDTCPELQRSIDEDVRAGALGVAGE
ncbi:hypothetical protein ACPZ19_24610 [Amycolatopsis lurida]|uniref:hypothetical protein n=1 Tax=Amycolatopsis sp. YIM 10 TaxID=2653857 RepID=UPI0012A7A1DC|nr:hypothetical protein [Amycolatopsis sp. YIM 10]QFU88072.1 hypothetical protein YIM_14430 [Amycolatopsis sp. YIM 10]